MYLSPDDESIVHALDRGVVSSAQYAAIQDGAVLKIPTPGTLHANIFGHDSYGWGCEIYFQAIGLQTGEPDTFRRLFRFTNRPTLQEIADAMTEQMRHEIEEQLGLDPHAKEGKR
jgi:hypothetical protein